VVNQMDRIIAKKNGFNELLFYGDDLEFVTAGAVTGVEASGARMSVRYSDGTTHEADVFGAGCVVITAFSSLLRAENIVRPRLVTKNTTARIAVARLRKLADPVEPNTLPEAPLPKAAPTSAPLPCCSNTSPMMATAVNTCTTRSSISIFLSSHAAGCAERQMAANSSAFRAAPPIRPPSTSGMPKSCEAFAAFTLPPYSIVRLAATPWSCVATR